MSEEIFQRKETAERYDSARALLDETMALWMDILTSLIPVGPIGRVLDIGGGTGRFAAALGQTYSSPVAVVDPSAAMLGQGMRRGSIGVSWTRGSAERLPLRSQSQSMVWMSNVFHHLENRTVAFQEISRVLKPAGYLVVRNGTREDNDEILWYRFFPEAKRLDEARIPLQQYVTDFVRKAEFDVITVRTVRQMFTSSYAEYYDKISQRGLSSLISIDDEAFSAGLERLREWVALQPPDEPVYEPIDLFVFRKR